MPELFALADAPDRVGMAEIQHITGLYAFWDELLARHPGLIIDNCAGGGQRIDLETIARSVPLWRSDRQCWPFDPIAMQTQTQGLAPWIPLSAAVCEAPTQYALRSALGPGLVTHWSSQALDGGVDLPVERDPPVDGRKPRRCASTSTATSIRCCPSAWPTTPGQPGSTTGPTWAKAWWWPSGGTAPFPVGGETAGSGSRGEVRAVLMGRPDAPGALDRQGCL